MNMSIERQRIANKPDHGTIFFPTYIKVITILQEIILIVRFKIISNSMPWNYFESNYSMP